MTRRHENAGRHVEQHRRCPPRRRPGEARGRNLHTLVFQTGQAAWIDGYAGASGPAAGPAHEIGLRAIVGVPISVEGGCGAPWR
jgi:hypothetical protein